MISKTAFALVLLLALPARAGIIQDLIGEGALVLYHDYRAGHTLDLSGQGNDGISTGHWSSEGIQFGATDEVTVADAPEIQLAAGGTLGVLGEFHDQPPGRLIDKRDAGGTNYDLYLTATDVQFYDGTHTRLLATSVIGHRYVAVNMGDGTIGEVFVDGLSVGNLNAASAISVDDAPLLFGNDHGGTAHTNATLSALFIINRKLTASEHARLYAELSSLTWPSKGSVKAQGVYGPELIADGDQEAATTGAYTAGGSATLTKETGNVLGGSQVLRVAYNGTNDPYAFQTILIVGARYRITGWARGDATFYMYIIDGVVAPWVGTNSTTWQYFDITIEAQGTILALVSGANAAGYSEFDNVSVKEVHAGETQWKSDWNAHVSATNVATGYLENTPFQINTGSWRIGTDTIDGETVKVIECVVNGMLYLDAQLIQGDATQDAYGTWEWWGYKTDIAVSNIGFINPTKTIAGGGDYYLAWQADETSLIWETGAGTVVSDPSIPHSTWVHFRITREQSNGAFELFIDGVTQGTGTDATITASSYWVFNPGLGGKIAYSDSAGNHAISKRHGVIAL